MKRILTVLMSAIMVLSMMPAMAFAAEENVAKIGDTKYATLQQAVEAAPENEEIEITLLKDVTEISTVTITENKNIILDLNGKSIEADTRPENALKHYYAIDNYGRLTINDTSAEGSGVIKARGIENLESGVMTLNGGTIISCDSNGGAAIWNTAKLTINGGVLKTLHVGSPNDKVGIGCLNNSGIATIHGGSFEGANRRTYAIISTNEITISPEEGKAVVVKGAHGGLAVDSGTAVINGGEYSSTEYYGLYVSNDGVGIDPVKAAVTVNGGTFDGPNYSVWIGSDYNDPVNSTIEINGGEFKKPLNAQECTREGAICIKGGVFSSAPKKEHISNGYLSEKDENVEKWTVRARKSAELKTDIGEKTFIAGDSNWTEFTFSTVANDDQGIIVVGGSDFGKKYEDKIAGLEYKEGDNWIDMKGKNFGGSTGFPMSNATSTFRVKFTSDAVGSYNFTAAMTTVDGSNELCKLDVPFEVKAPTPVTPPTPEPEDPITNTGSGDNASTNVDASDNTTTSDSGKTETTIDSTLGDKIVENAKENNAADVVIKAETEKGDSTGSTVALQESTVQALAKETEASVTIKTDSAEVSLDKAAVDAVAAQAGTDGEVKLVVETVENTADTLKVELKLVTSKGTVTDFQGGNVTVTVPVSEELAGKKLVCVYIDENGKYIKMDGSLASDGKTFTFTTGHFSTYAILSEEEANAAIDGQNISKATVSGLANKTYTGKAITQKLTVKAGDKALVEGTDYTVSYSKNVNVGVASVKITGKGKYEGTLTKTFKINPKGTSISKVTGQKKTVKVVWKKQLTKMKTSYVSGYQVQYSTSSKFTSGTSKYANAKFSKGRTTKTIKNLKSGKKYYVRVRTYKSVNGTKCYSSWSKAKSVKTK